MGPWHEDFYRRLETPIHSLGLADSVVFTGLIDNSDLIAFYNLADVYIMVSREPTPNEKDRYD